MVKALDTYLKADGRASISICNRIFTTGQWHELRGYYEKIFGDPDELTGDDPKVDGSSGQQDAESHSSDGESNVGETKVPVSLLSNGIFLHSTGSRARPSYPTVTLPHRTQ